MHYFESTAASLSTILDFAQYMQHFSPIKKPVNFWVDFRGKAVQNRKASCCSRRRSLWTAEEHFAEDFLP